MPLRRGGRGAAVRSLQRRLRELGYDPGPIDGIFGRRTEAAVLAFQRDAGLTADGVVGPRTWSALAEPACASSGPRRRRRAGRGTAGSWMRSDLGDPPWLVRAHQELAAWTGASATERTRLVDTYIFEFYDSIGRGSRVRNSPADLASLRRFWCALFVGWILHQCGISHSRSAAARSYLWWGRDEPEDLCGPPRRGAITVFSRPDPSHTDGGHVAFYLGMRRNQIMVLGGNQSRRVRISAYPADRLLAFRWPATSC